MNVISLFSGVGGLELGLERAGMTTVGQVEIDAFCRQVLAKHWPEVPRHDDVRTAVDWWRSAPRPPVHVAAGGFPCQPVSVAGRQLAQADERWLWPAFADVIRHLRPRYAVMENVPGLLARGVGDVLGDLAALGYDAEWDCVPAAAVGAPHRRDRVFIVAYADGRGLAEQQERAGEPVAGFEASLGSHAVGLRPDVADTDGVRREQRPRFFGEGRRGQPADGGRWSVEPDVGRVAHGVPARMDRLRALGNAVVPQVAEHVGRLILAADAERGAA